MLLLSTFKLLTLNTFSKSIWFDLSTFLTSHFSTAEGCPSFMQRRRIKNSVCYFCFEKKNDFLTFGTIFVAFRSLQGRPDVFLLRLSAFLSFYVFSC